MKLETMLAKLKDEGFDGFSVYGIESKRGTVYKVVCGWTRGDGRIQHRTVCIGRGPTIAEAFEKMRENAAKLNE